MGAPVITALYVPGDRPERFDKAVASGTQMVIVDLEDAVAPDRKALALDALVDWLRARVWASGPAIQVRVNVDHRAEVERLAEIDGPVELRLPKVESPGDLEVVGSAAHRFWGVTALIESALGVERVAEIANHPAVTGVALGEADLASDLGTGSDAVLDHARLRVLYAARAAGLAAPMMSVFANVADLDGLRADTARGRTLGLVGRAAIHPRQLAVIAAVFRPTAAEIDQAREVLDAAAAGGVTTLPSGEMVDPAMAGLAAAVISMADAVASAEAALQH